MSYPAADLLCCNEPEHNPEPGYLGLRASITGPAALCFLPQIILLCENETFFHGKDSMKLKKQLSIERLM